MKEYAKKFYKGTKWNRCRASYIAERIAIDGGVCEECHEALGYIVHHKVPITPDNISNADITLNHENLEYVCKNCHDKFEGHGLNKKGHMDIIFDEAGQPMPAPLSKSNF